MKASKTSFSYLTLTFSMICIFLRVLNEFHFHLVIPVQMNRRNSTIELSSSFQPEIRQGRVAGKSFKKIRYRPDCFLIRAIIMVKKHMHENLKDTVTKHLAKKIKKYSQFQTITANNRKHVSDFISNNIDTFMELLPTILHTFLDIKQY